jgi:uncharacterized caspase-like protein
MLSSALVCAAGALVCGRSVAQSKRAGRAPINALVIGASYNDAPPSFHLANAVSDAAIMADFLKADPQRKVMLVTDPDRDGLTGALTAYLDSLGAGDVALIYFAGHGVQVEGLNYIVSGDGESLIPIGDIVLRAREKAKLVLLFLDACRNNPFSLHKGPQIAGARSIEVDRLQSRGLKRTGAAETPGDTLKAISLDSPELLASNGLAQFRLQGRGIKVIFSTDPGNVALDAVARSSNSPFTLSLVKALAQRKSLDEALADVTRDVVAETGGKQTPWVQGSLEEPVFVSGRPARYDNGDVVMPMP